MLNIFFVLLLIGLYTYAEHDNSIEQQHKIQTPEDIAIEKLQKTIDSLTKKLELLEKEDLLSIYAETNKSFGKIDKKEIENINKSLSYLKAQIYIIDKKLKEADYKKTLEAKNEQFRELSDEKKQKSEKDRKEKLNQQQKIIEGMEAEIKILELKLSLFEKQIQLAEYKTYDVGARSKKLAEYEELKLEVEKLKLKVEQEEAKLRLAKVELENQKIKLLKDNNALMQITFQNEVLKQQKDNLQYQVDIIKNKEILRQEEDKAREVLSSGGIQYLEEPFKKNGVLVLSDRQIKIGLFIDVDTTNEVNRLIDFYNNDEIHKKYPIFLIFDECWGGRCDCMLDIINKMQQSESPVYVVVKKAAYSAAAVITTCAAKSFIARGAQMLHHQVHLGVYSRQNVKKLEEFIVGTKTYAKKCFEPMLLKLKCSYEQFVEKMYKNSCDGEDWRLLDQAAVKEKWADVVISGIRDTSVLNKKNEGNYEKINISVEQENLSGKIISDLSIGKLWYISLKQPLVS